MATIEVLGDASADGQTGANESEIPQATDASPPTSQLPAIEVSDYSFSYPSVGDIAPYQALENINFSVDQGSFVILAGMTGSGKSTLLTSLKAELAPMGKRNGQLKILGEPIHYDDTKIDHHSIQVGYVLQDPAAQIVTDTVWHELAFGLENLGTPHDEMHRRIAETSSFFGITSWFERSTSELSGGQKQLLNLAAIMVMQPRILLLDEPTSQLDPLATREFINALYRVNQELGITVLIITHDLEEVAPLADQVIFIHEKTVTFSGSFQAFIDKCIENYPSYLPALPSATQLAHLIEPDFRPLPLTVRDGRDWLINRLGTNQGDKPSAKQPEQAEAIATDTNLPTVLEARHLWFAYSRTDPPVLKELSLEIKAGRIKGIVGSNASGKSTLLSVLAGVRKAQRGTLKRASGLVSAVLPQDPKALFTQDSTLAELLDNGQGGQHARSEVDYWVDRLGLSELMDRHPYDLSGGEQQKTALIKLLLIKPELLLLDEPTKGLDAFTKAELMGILRDLANDGHAIVIVSHDLDFVANVADDCSMLFNGALVGTGTTEQFFSGNIFYTTVIYRITRECLPGCVRLGDVYYRVS